MTEESNCDSCPSASDCGGACPSQEELSEAQKHSHIKNIIVVMSGKGGVGKSSFSSLLAIALKKKGYRVSLMDADITGPSIPKLFGVNDRPEFSEYGAEPIKSALGISLMSMNFLLPKEDEPVIWRGPVVAGVIQEFWKNVHWGEVDYLIVDMPPGTGDVSLTVLQTLPITGALIVTTPQNLSNMVVRKGVKMLELMETPIVGLAENMAYLVCPDCEHKIRLFGESHGDETAKMHNIPYLGEFPLDPELTALGDSGHIESYDGPVLNKMLEAVEQIEREKEE